MDNTKPTGRAPVYRVTAIRERTVQYVKGPHDALNLARTMLDDYDREAFLVIYLNSKHGVAGCEVVAVGTINATLVHPREVFKGAMLANSVAIVVAHNHPSGDATPSPEDHALTAQLLQAGEILGIRVMDHLVIGYDTAVSMRENTHIWRDAPFHR